MTEETKNEEWKNHVATYEKHGEDLETLQWKNPAENHFAIFYVRQHGCLMIWGDLGSAVHRWYPDMSMESMADTSLDYFVSKCEASEEGRKPYAFDYKEAEKDIKQYFDEFAKDRNHEYEPDPDVKWANEELIGRAKQEMLFDYWNGHGNLEDQYTWVAWMRDHADEVFGDDWWDGGFPVDCGEKLSERTKLHHDGLKAAFKQLNKNKEEGSN